MKISEVFPAIQGEGKYAGIPTVFLRTSGCNLNCKFCDSKYHTNGEHISVGDLSRKVASYGFRDITITGGEPMMQKTEMFALTRMLPGRRFHLETNGTFYDERLEDFYSVTVSPKKQALDMLLKPVRKLANLDNTTFKFVYESKDDLWWLGLAKAAEISLDNIYIMPEGKTREEQESKMSEVMEYCLKNGFKFSPRLHVLAYGDKRGV